MGTWGTGTFDNDTACDWAYGLDAVDDLSLIEDAIEAVMVTGSDYLDSDIAVEALAACEVLARLRGQRGKNESDSEAVDSWVLAHPIAPPTDLVKKAVAAIDRVLTEPSELLELWGESEDKEIWRGAVADLRRRVANGLS